MILSGLDAAIKNNAQSATFAAESNYSAYPSVARESSLAVLRQYDSIINRKSIARR
jgi:hypothetical protein